MTRRLPLDLARFVAHAPDCACFGCGRCGLSLDHEVHYVGTVDDHRFEPRACDCPRAFILEVLEERRLHDSIAPRRFDDDDDPRRTARG